MRYIEELSRSLPESPLTDQVRLYMEMAKIPGIEEGMPTVGYVIRESEKAHVAELRDTTPALPGKIKQFRKQSVLVVLGPPGVGKTSLVDKRIKPYYEAGDRYLENMYGIDSGTELFRWDDFENRVLGPFIASKEIDLTKPTSPEYLLKVSVAMEEATKKFLQERDPTRRLIIEIPAGGTDFQFDDERNIYDVRPHGIQILYKLINGEMIPREELLLSVVSLSAGVHMQVYDTWRDDTIHAIDREDANELREASGLEPFASDEEFQTEQKSGSLAVIKKT